MRGRKQEENRKAADIGGQVGVSKRGWRALARGQQAQFTWRLHEWTAGQLRTSAGLHNVCNARFSPHKIFGSVVCFTFLLF